MKNKISDYINIIIEQHFLNFGINLNYNKVLQLINSLESVNLYKIQQLTFSNSFKFVFTLFSSEIFLFCGLIIVLLYFGFNFNKMLNETLLLKINRLITKILKIISSIAIIQ